MVYDGWQMAGGRRYWWMEGYGWQTVDDRRWVVDVWH